MRTILGILLCLSMAAGTLNGQSASQKTTALKTDQAISVDGSLDEAIWEDAPEITGFIQFQPER